MFDDFDDSPPPACPVPRRASIARLKAMARRLAWARNTDPAAIQDYGMMTRAAMKMARPDRIKFDFFFGRECRREAPG